MPEERTTPLPFYPAHMTVIRGGVWWDTERERW